MRHTHLLSDFAFAGLYRLVIGEDYADYADYFADCDRARAFRKRYHFDLLHSGRFYGHDIADKPRFVGGAVHGKRLVREMGKMDVEATTITLYGDHSFTDSCRANRLLKTDLSFRTLRRPFFAQKKCKL